MKQPLISARTGGPRPPRSAPSPQRTKPDRILLPLGARLALPLLAGLIMLPLCLLGMGYHYAREQSIEEATLHIRQLESFATRQNYYSRKWIEGNITPVAGALEASGAEKIFEPSGEALRLLKERIAAMLNNERGQSDIVIYLENWRGGYYAIRFAKGEPPLSFEPPAAEALSLVEGAGSKPGWQGLMTSDGEDRKLVMRYSVPLYHMRARFGLLTANVSMPWFMERVRSISNLTGFTLFFMVRDGSWTLPDSPHAEDKNEKSSIDAMAGKMRAERRGSTQVLWNGQPHVGVFMPLIEDELVLGLLIPKDQLFGRLSRLAGVLGITAGVILLLSALILRKTTNDILRPVRELGGIAEKLARGDFSPASGESRGISRESRRIDEPARLRAAAENLRNALRQREKDLTMLATARARLFGEMELAGKLRQNLYNTSPPEADNLAVAAETHQAGAVCSEMCDCFFADSYSLCCVMGSVAAHGIPAALLMDRVLPLLRELLLSGLGPGPALENANRILCSYSPLDKKAISPLVSVMACVLRRDNGCLAWACAGRNPPYRVFAGRAVQLRWSGDLHLGAKSDARYNEMRASLKPGELLFMCGEKLCATANPEGRRFGEARLRELLEEHTGDPRKLTAKVYGALAAHAGRPGVIYDISMLAVRWQGRVQA